MRCDVMRNSKYITASDEPRLQVPPTHGAFIQTCIKNIHDQRLGDASLPMLLSLLALHHASPHL